MCIGYDRDALDSLDLFCNAECGGAGVQEDGISAMDESGAQVGNPVFGFLLGILAKLEGDRLSDDVAQVRPSIHPGEKRFLFHLKQVASYGLLAHIECGT